MSILFVGNVAADFGASWSDSDSLTVRDAAYSPTAMFYNGQTDNDPGSAGVVNLPANPTGDVWLHYRYRSPNTNISNSTVDGHFITFRAANGAQLARFDILDNGIRAEANGDTNVVGASTALSPNTIFTFDLRLVVGANITLDLYQNGSLISSATAANAGGKGVCRQIVFDMFDYSSNANGQFQLSEAIVTDEGESTIGWRLATFDPISAGFHTGWEGDFSSVSNPNDGRFLYAGAADLRESWIHSAYAGPSSPASIRAVVAKLAGDRGGTGPQNVAPFLRIGGADYDAPSVPLDYRFRQLGVWSQNPATASAWTTAELAALEAGVRSLA